MRDKTPLEINLTFLNSKRGLLKIAEMVTLFVAFVCFALESRPLYIAATFMELSVTLTLFLLYLLKLNKMLNFFFWSLIDMFNSFLTAVFMCIICLVAVFTYTPKGTLVGGIVGLIASVLYFLDGFDLFRKITFNLPTTAS